MKRIYTTLGLIAAAMSFGTSSFGQIADLAAFVQMSDFTCLNAGTTIYGYDTAVNGVQQPLGYWGAVNLGPDDVTSGTSIMYAMPMCDFNDSTINVYLGQTQFDAPADSVAWIQHGLPVDSIKSLINIDTFTSVGFGASLVHRADLQDGQTYGFYLWILGLGNNPNSPDNIDTVVTNDIAYVPVKWHCNTGIQEMMEEAARDISIFPNPAQNELHFRYGFIKATEKATARVIDMTGRVLASKELGKNNFGTKEFNMDISTLPAGNYLLEISTGYMNAVGKFTVTK